MVKIFSEEFHCVTLLRQRERERNDDKINIICPDCGGIIREPQVISPLIAGAEYLGRMNCTWQIIGPKGMSAVVRFEHLDIEYSPRFYNLFPQIFYESL